MRIVKFIFLCLFVLILLALPVGGSLWLERGLWPGLLVSGGMLSLILLFFFIRALWLRHREKRFIDGILEEQPQSKDSMNKQLSGELTKRWKEAVGELKKSQLKQKGNPLYVLPWYMLIGESHSGKTTAIKNAKLNTTFTSQPRVAGVSGTKNCDWWFFEEAIIIDTAGRYTSQPDEVNDQNEWRVFLAQLSKYRKKEPLNGLVVTLSADSILTSKPADLEEEGRKIRVRIEELMQSLGAKFPVYLLVTKCDLIRGMKEFCDALPESAHDQAFGYLDPAPDKDRDGFLDRAFNTLKERLRFFRLHLANKTGVEQVPTEAVFFPEEFLMLKKGLEPFAKAAFNKNSYQEAPLLRGMYFTSGRQSGEPVSHFMSKLKLSPAKGAPKESEKSYFLHDFFKTVLPKDRGLFAPTQHVMDWATKTKAMGLSAWVLAGLVLCGFLSYSFAMTLSNVKQFQKEFSHPPEMSGELLKDLNTLEHMRQAILSIEKQNQNRWLPRFGLNQSETIEKDLKATYCRSFADDFLLPYDTKLDQATLDFSEKTSGQRMGSCLSLYARRITLTEDAVAGAGLDVLEPKPQPDFTPLVFTDGSPAIPEALDLLETQYHHYLIWEDDTALAQSEKQMTERLKHLLLNKGMTLSWLTQWANEEGKPIVLSDFWKGSGHLKDEVTIQPAYTTQGFESITRMLTEFEGSLGDPLSMEKKKRDFLDAYRQDYLNNWHTFMRMFPKGAFTLSGKEEKLSAARKMAGKENPYMVFLDTMATELSALADEDMPLPAWMKPVMELSEIKTYEENTPTDAQKKNGLLDKAKKMGLSKLGKAGRLARSISVSPESLMVSSQVYKRYKAALTELSKSCASAPASFKLASQVFSEDVASGTSSMALAQQAADELKVTMEYYTSDQKDFARFLNGPVDFMWSLVVKQAACHLQTIWDEAVIAEVQGVYDQKVLTDMLLGQDGYVNKFTGGPGAPFIRKSRRTGYYARKAAGESMPFHADFLGFLTRGAYSVKSAENLYKVKIDGLPTDTNPDATIMPHVTKLELECAAGSQSLENYNYPVSHTFEWSPSECGDVSLSILIGNIVLKKSYSGFRPFARFLKDFRNGYHTFYRSDFPDQNSDLKRMGIKFIKVKYKISGGGPVIMLLNMAAGKAPEEIVKCLD